MELYKLLFALVLSVLVDRVYCQGRSKSLWVKKFACIDQPYPKTLLHLCELRSPRNRAQYASLVFEPTETVRKIFADVNLYRQYKQSRMYIYGTTVDYCLFIENVQASQNPVAQIGYNVARKKFPALLISCPATGIVNITGVQIDDDLVPPHITPATYAAELRAYNKRNQTLLSVLSEFTLLRGGLLDGTLKSIGQG